MVRVGCVRTSRELEIRRGAKARVAMAATGILLLSVGCSWVALDSPEAERVRVASADEVTECRRVGATKARTQPTLGIFDRSDAKVAEELETLARNDAPGLGGDTVVAEGPITLQGVQDFGIFDCSGTSG